MRIFNILDLPHGHSSLNIHIQIVSATVSGENRIKNELVEG
jgi:hypothetical protein